jgi:hypothetical protein
MTNYKSKYHYTTFSTVIRAVENYILVKLRKLMPWITLIDLSQANYGQKAKRILYKNV